MMPFPLSFPQGRAPRILYLGAHCDDIEIGCGGAALRLADLFPDAVVRWMIFTGSPVRRREAEASAAEFLERHREREIHVLDHRDGFLPYLGAEVKDAFEALRRGFEPDLIFTHHREDLHQDHRLIAELTYNTFRNHLVLEYEIPKYDGDFGNPNLFLPLDPGLAERKASAILRHFQTQHGRSWFTSDTFMSVMRLRGVAANSPTGFAEGFYSRKSILIG